ncbi:MAG: hypothetical protein COX77_03990 [Candidatus Komeilibacteria bacterium CG_4_10_14_0_2_um_filter_37_10]|uniref:Uncharacterized protein n=1 Tax=Candidatus Komeilibacteria bacterium CG_4_10_14_0_2_um_filter_37_10 TaxID=1974470 RepID=A0A2M7VDW6_9BACT|nr:MAG: hypothetical protein COX77_03990 [Candidatus Komeilibacteria bacterium CG_4_10_14_0_2_um_filter_37_10]PJA93770.1 MAG: hypothetical protein CO133_00990 [Candidatus Komeilibacteria bacterium CG_4_9_14_3_um_filter_37_5]
MALSPNKTKIIFFSSDHHTWPVLRYLAQNVNYDVLLITKNEKPIGRNQVMSANNLALEADKNNISTVAVSSIDQELNNKIADFQPAIIFVYSFGLIFPTWFITTYGDKTINIHPSDLPKYRGSSPLQAALLKGDKKTAVSFIKLANDVDAGDVLCKYPLIIQSTDQYLTLSQSVNQSIIQQIDNFINQYLNHKLTASTQGLVGLSKTRKINKQNGLIDWQLAAVAIFNKWRAYYYWPEIYTYWQNSKLILKEIALATDQNQIAHIGQIYQSANKQICVQCGVGSIIILQIQLAGKKQMPIELFINGQRTFIDSSLANPFSQ